MWLLAVFVAVPLIEIALFIQIGGLIGLWPTLAVVVLTAIIGVSLVRAQGLLAMGQLRTSLVELHDPTEPLAHGAMILLAGALLLTPGFFTDSIGFALLVPGVRSAAYRVLRDRVRMHSFEIGSAGRGTHGRKPPEDTTVDGEFEDVTPKSPPNQRSSGWTRH